MTTLIIGLFLLLMLLGVPVVFALLGCAIISIITLGDINYLPLIFTKFTSGIESFTLLALPFFILAGNIMGKGGITGKIIDFSKVIVGHKKGGLGHVVILSSTIYSALTGSAVAATSAIGSMMIPQMVKEGYTKKYATAVTSAATVLGPIIPPSGIMIIYAFAMNVSIGSMFMAAIVPGILFCVSLMIMNYYLSLRKGFDFVSPKATTKEKTVAFKKSFLALMTPVIILGGIYGGIFTPTEAAAVAVLYAVIVAVFIYRSITLKDLIPIIKDSAINSASVLLLVGGAVGFGVVVSLTDISNLVTDFLYGFADNPYLLFAVINVILLLIGMFLDAGPAILIFAPILAPPLINMGIDPVHFGVVMCINVTIGLATPPMGLVLFVASSLSKISLEEIAKEALPFILIEILIVFLISFMPALVMGLPRLLGM